MSQAAAPDETTDPPSHRLRLPWLWLGLGIVAVGWALLYFGLDPWLRRRLEKQVAEQTGGRYQLQVGDLRTRLTDRSLTITGVRLRPTAQFRPGPDSLPRLAFDLPRLQLTGISLSALWRKRAQYLDSLAVTGLRLRIDSLPTALFRSGRPLHERLPARVPGLQLDRLVLRDARVIYVGRRRPRLAVQRLDLTAHDVQLNPAGAADTARLLYARAWQAQVRRAQGRFDHHRGQLQSLTFDSRTGVVALDSFQMRPTRIGRRGPTYLTMHIRQARLTGLRAPALRRRRFQADSLRIAGLRFDLTAPATPPPLPHQMIRPLRSLALADARLTDAYVRVRGVSHVPIIRDLQLHATRLRLDSAAWLDPARVYYAHAWEMATGAGQTLVDAPYYRVSWASIRAESGPGLLEVSGVRVAPTFPLDEMARRKKHEVSHITVRVPTLRATGFDFDALLHRRGLLAADVLLRAPAVLVRGDGRFPINPETSVVTPEAMGKLPFRVDLRRIRVADCSLGFWYIGPTSPRAATMHVTRLNGTITNATNDPARMSARAPMVATASGRLQDLCFVQARGTFNVLDPAGRHRLTGTFGAAPFGMLNPVTEPASLLRFKEGQVQRVTVTLTGDRERVTGEMRAAYTGMHVRFLTKDLDQNLITKVKSKAANKLVLHDNNPDEPGEALRVGPIESRRERRFSVFALWKQGLVSGLLTSLGVSEKLAQRTSEKTTNPGE